MVSNNYVYSKKITNMYTHIFNIWNKNITPELRSLHVSIIFSGNKVISSGYNNINRPGIYGRYTISEHAEIAACRDYLHQQKNAPKKYCLLRGNT